MFYLCYIFYFFTLLVFTSYCFTMYTELLVLIFARYRSFIQRNRIYVCEFRFFINVWQYFFHLNRMANKQFERVGNYSKISCGNFQQYVNNVTHANLITANTSYLRIHSLHLIPLVTLKIVTSGWCFMFFFIL